MELVAAPQLRIAGGKTVTETKLRPESHDDSNEARCGQCRAGGGVRRTT